MKRQYKIGDKVKLKSCRKICALNGINYDHLDYDIAWVNFAGKFVTISKLKGNSVGILKKGTRMILSPAFRIKEVRSSTFYEDEIDDLKIKLKMLK